MNKNAPAAQRLNVVIIDDIAYRRRLVAETLPCLGSMRIDQASSSEHGLELIRARAPDLIITDWDLETKQGAAFVKDIRSGKAGDEAKRLPIIMMGDNVTNFELDLARNAGVDEFVARPFSVASLTQRFRAALEARREFIMSAVYIGPCRRRGRLQLYRGPRRRLFDEDTDMPDAPMVKVQKDQVRTLIKMIAGLLNGEKPDRRRMRDIFIAARDIDQLAADMDDPNLLQAADSLFSYVQGVGATPRLVPKVIEAHLDALTQLVDLPNSQIDLRTTVVRELGKLVDKKLRGAAEIAA
jgi:DNA-binding response OmpR family regulator